LARVYSTNFLEGGPSNPWTDLTYVNIEGNTVVVREMTFYASRTFCLSGAGFAVTMGAYGAVIWSLAGSECNIGRVYMWEGREVMEGFGQIVASCSDATTSVRVNGYLLTP